jgi:FO synthase
MGPRAGDGRGIAMKAFADVLRRSRAGKYLPAADFFALLEADDLPALTEVAAELRDRGHSSLISYSRKVFIPLTQLCRDSCHYCTFARPPRRGVRAYLTTDEVLAIARAGAAAGCREALFTLGDKPERRYRAVREELAALGHKTTISYLTAMAELVLKETGLLPHLNAGVLSAEDLAVMRHVCVSQGLMLETSAARLGLRGGPHFGSPDKQPTVRMQVIRSAGEARIPFTSGILIGIGETRRERLTALLGLRGLHERYGHLQEIIIQNFRAKPGTKMSGHPEPALDDHLWTLAAARLVFGAQMNIQTPPNLSPGVLHHLIAAGINDWGGVSPVTPDHVNPERPWPQIDTLAQETAKAGKVLVERLAVYPPYVQHPETWLDPALRTIVARASDGQGYARADRWIPGTMSNPPVEPTGILRHTGPGATIARALAGLTLTEDEIVALFGSRGDAFHAVCEAADSLRAATCGDEVTYVVTRNINYTNICLYRCKFCAFSKGKLSDHLRGRPYDLGLEEIQRRAAEAWDRGAVEVCLQGGIHPNYDGSTYVAICRAIKEVCPRLHIHAFSPLEVWHGASTLGVSLEAFLSELKEAGLGSLPGTAAEVLDDEVRAVICPDKVSTAQWLEIVETAHRLGIGTTATIMFGHVDRYWHWARHLLRLRELQSRTGGITEFVPLPFVPMETPLHLRGLSRLGPTYREAVLMHAVARLALHPVVKNVQTSWVKMGKDGVSACLAAGTNDLGGTLMNESITRAAGALHGEEMPPEAMEEIIESLGRRPRQRTTVYGEVAADRVARSFGAAPLRSASMMPVTQQKHGPQKADLSHADA